MCAISKTTARLATGPLLLGIDTGGTFTDAVLYDEGARSVVASAKSPTTHDDLSVGVVGAISTVLGESLIDPAVVDLVSLSTTLATNALVEGRGGRVGAVVIGFDPDVLGRAGLDAALGGDPVLQVGGGHDAHGSEVERFDPDALGEAIRASGCFDRVEAVAVVSQFSVRNPAHELAAMRVVRDLTGLPVTCSHLLSAGLNGPKRLVTAVLNARLTGLIAALVDTVERSMGGLGIDAPLMVVRGDGSLVSAAFVRERPIETILSGPAASIVGAAHLTGLRDAVVSDIGGTTTDIAILRNGIPRVSDDGAKVGGHSTMVRAVAMHTHGLGGDSEVRHDDRAVGCRLMLGPRRVVPISSLASARPDLVHGILDRQLLNAIPGEWDAVVVLPAGIAPLAGHGPAEAAMLQAIGDGAAAASVVSTSMSARTLERMISSGLVRISAFTPTDAAHVLGDQDMFDRAAAHKAAGLVARRRDRVGKPIATDGAALSRAVVDTLVRLSAEAVLAAAFEQDGLDPSLVTRPPVREALDRLLGAVRLSVSLAEPIVGLGASAPLYYPHVGDVLSTSVVVPEHAGVANAVGAVAGRIRLSREVTISSPTVGLYAVHVPGADGVFTDLDVARSRARDVLREALVADLSAAGAGEVEIDEQWEERTVDLEGLTMFLDATLRLTGSGRPALAARS